MGIISWVLLGLIAGGIAKKFIPGVAPSGCLPTFAVGVAGSALGGIAASLLLHVQMNSFFSLSTWAVAILGSIGALWAYKTWLDNRGYGPIKPDPGATRNHQHDR